MATIKIQDLEQREVSSEEAKMVQGGWARECAASQVSGGSESTFTGGVRVATGDVKG